MTSFSPLPLCLCHCILLALMSVGFFAYADPLDRGSSKISNKIRIMLPDNDYHWFRHADMLKIPYNISNVKTLFDFHPIGKGRRIGKIDKVDIFTWKEWGDLTMALADQRVNYSATIPPTFVTNKESIMQLFNQKTTWLQFMKTVGLGAHVPIVYSKTCDRYPCILKNSKVHFGKGVHVVLNESHLERVIADTVHGNDPYHLEEGLNGWGLVEGSAFGSVYQGKLVSLRCMIRNHTDASTLRKKTSGSASQGGGLYVRGIKRSKAAQWFIPCGKDVFVVLSKMFKALESPYTGAFCADFKGNGESKPKFMEINARACGTHTNDEKIFISTYVPLAFAIREDLLAKQDFSPAPQWYSMKKFKGIYETEKENLRKLNMSTQMFRLDRKVDIRKSFPSNGRKHRSVSWHRD